MKSSGGKFTVVAIDEAGRGPLAGPVAVAAVAAKAANSKWKIANGKILKGVRDSKKLSAKQRDEWFKKLKNNFDYKVAMVGPCVIDRIGINRATKLAVNRALRRFEKRPDMVLLDGLLCAPKHFNQETIIKGDEKVPLISAASIIAKVYRDRKMHRLHKLYPEYCFDCHKGYGTKKHYKRINRNGISENHRRTFLKNISNHA